MDRARIRIDALRSWHSRIAKPQRGNPRPLPKAHQPLPRLTTVHITAIIVWITGMGAAAFVLAHPSREVLSAIRRFDRCITTPAVLLAWIFGTLLAIHGRWFGAGWLWAKLACVVMLSGLDGLVSGRLRGMKVADGIAADDAARILMPVGFGLVAVIVLLVTTKAA